MKYGTMALAIAATIVLSACGGGGSSGSDACTFSINSFTNGANAAAATSVWNCTASSGSYTFAFYSDGAGYSSALDAFTWSEVGCKEVDIQASNGTNQIRNIEGSVSSGIGTFTQTFPSGNQSTASCTLQTVSASSAPLSGERLLYGGFQQSGTLVSCFSGVNSSETCTQENDPFAGTVYIYFTDAYEDANDAYQVNSGSSVEIENVNGDILYSVPDEGSTAAGRRFTVTHNNQSCVSIIVDFPEFFSSDLGATCTQGDNVCYVCYGAKFN